MEYSSRDARSLRERVERLEKQNRRITVVCSVLILVPIFACQPRSSPVVEAQRFVLRDSSGKIRAEIAMSYDTGPKGYPALRLLDENGKARTAIGAGVLSITGEEGTHVTLLDNSIQFADSAGVTADLGSRAGRASLFLFGKDANSILLNADTPVVELADANGFHADLGRNELVTPHIGETKTTSAASLVLADKDGKILWQVPR